MVGHKSRQQEAYLLLIYQDSALLSFEHAELGFLTAIDCVNCGLGMWYGTLQGDEEASALLPIHQDSKRLSLPSIMAWFFTSMFFDYKMSSFCTLVCLNINYS